MDLNEEDFMDECMHVSLVNLRTRLTDLLADIITIDDEVIIDNVSLRLHQ